MKDWIIVAFIIFCSLLVLPRCANKQKMETALRGMLASEIDRQSERYKQKYVTDPCEDADRRWDEMIKGLKASILEK